MIPDRLSIRINEKEKRILAKAMEILPQYSMSDIVRKSFVTHLIRLFKRREENRQE